MKPHSLHSAKVEYDLNILNQFRIILASQSVQRKTMMDTLMEQCIGNIPYEVMPADIDELAVSGPTQYSRIAQVALAKGQAIQAKIGKNTQTQVAILAADTYLADADDVALEKPTTLREATEMLAFQSGKRITAYTGVYWYDSITAIEESKTFQTEVQFRELSRYQIEQYVHTQPVITYSGAFCPAYPAGAALIQSVSGSFTSFSYGFPVEFFAPHLEKYVHNWI